jgi:hypothetical protein
LRRKWLLMTQSGQGFGNFALRVSVAFLQHNSTELPNSLPGGDERLMLQGGNDIFLKLKMGACVQLCVTRGKSCWLGWRR